MGIITQIAAWRKARPMRRSAKVALPDGKEVHIWELDGTDPETGIGVIEKKAQGKFLSFHVEGKPFGVVTGVYRRRARRGVSNGTLI